MNIASDFHNQLMAQERARVLLRISQGTKASSPKILDAKRMMPLYYSNPLPDNSSGSKNRPFFSSKDESGRATADQIVAMNQRRPHFGHDNMSDKEALHGGVLRHYAFARQILQRRARDTENINLASQGLPAEPSPLLELSDVESRKLELDTLLQTFTNQIEIGDITGLTIAELKNVPRLMVALSPVLTQNDITQLINTIDNLIMELEKYTSERTATGKNAVILYNYLDTRLRGFLQALMKIINYSPEDKVIAVRQLSKELFKATPTTTSFPASSTKSVPVMETEEGYVVPKPKAKRPRMGVIPPAPSAGVSESKEDEEPAIQTRVSRVTADEQANLRKAFKDNDTETLKQFLKDNTTLVSAKNFSSRTVMANRIQKYFHFDIRKK